MRKFTHIYIEEDILNHQYTNLVLNKFPNAEKILIKNYKNIFNRSNQDFIAQKTSPKLILAKKRDNFLYKGSENSNNFGNENFYYNTLILNCIYNCEYCYLQGMFPSSNIVIFVNLEDFFSQTELLLKSSEIYLCISYETDLLAFEEIVPFTSKWIQFANENPNLKLEIRTKSNQFKLISNLNPSPNIILAWTISPEQISKKYESLTPTLNKRIESLNQALKKNWKVRICIDPILHVKDWKIHYLEFLNYISKEINLELLYDISIGTFRINKDYLKKMKKLRENSILLHYPFQIEQNIAGYSETKKNEILEFISKELSKSFPKEKIYLS